MKASREIFNRNLKEAFVAANTTQKEIAKLVGITEPMLSDYLRGKKVPRSFIIHKLARALNVDPFWLRGATRSPGFVTSTDKPILMYGDLIRIGSELNDLSLKEERFIARYADVLSHMIKLNPIGLDLLVRYSRDLSELSRYNEYLTDEEVFTIHAIEDSSCES